MQALLSGVAVTFGYATGSGLHHVWHPLELPRLPTSVHNALTALAGGVTLTLCAFVRSKAAEWQNGIRSLMGLPVVDTTHPFRIGAIALRVFAALLLLDALFRRA